MSYGPVHTILLTIQIYFLITHTHTQSQQQKCQKDICYVRFKLKMTKNF
jgi:hypothetical protein